MSDLAKNGKYIRELKETFIKNLDDENIFSNFLKMVMKKWNKSFLKYSAESMGKTFINNVGNFFKGKFK